MSGLYTGTLLRYDFSGQNVISTTPIKVHFDQNGKALSGIWKEQAGDSIAFTATVNEKNIVFTNSTIERIGHFSHNQPKKYTFRKAQLQLVENQDDLYIVGNLQLYDIQQNEPEKPIYLILTRKNDHLLPQDAEHTVSQLLVYPNPVTTGQFNLYFDLAEQTPIRVKIYDLMGVQHYEQQLTTTGTGQQEQAINFTAPRGNYVLNLYYGSHVLRTILIKK